MTSLSVGSFVGGVFHIPCTLPSHGFIDFSSVFQAFWLVWWALVVAWSPPQFFSKLVRFVFVDVRQQYR
jgi:hypothetical protein